MKTTHIIITIILTSITTPAFGSGDPVAGKQKASVCIGCHGADGNSQIPSYPKLAGQLTGYIVKQTLDFRLGTRKDSVMSVMINIIPEIGDLQDISAYFNSQPMMSGSSSDAPLESKGKEIYFRERCHFCHAEGGRPTEMFLPTPPVIGGQHKEYLIKSLKDIKSGQRKADMYNLMAKTLAGMSDEDINAVSTFLGSL